jgi:uncharacterized protein (TIGR02996 family)
VTDSAEGAALVAAVVANPDEDTPRLVYADWLQDRGEDDRAEFIRVQCKIARCQWCGGGGKINSQRACVCKDANYPLRRRERELLRSHGAGWLGDLSDWRAEAVGPTGVAWTVMVGTSAQHVIPVEFRRGFVEQVTCSAEDWLSHGDAILAEHPVTRVTPSTDPRDLDGLDGESRLVLQAETGLLVWKCDRWPGVAFTMPPPVIDVTIDWNPIGTIGTQGFDESVSDVVDEIAQSLGIPPHLLAPPGT